MDKQVMAVGRLYRSILISQEADGYVIVSDSGQRFEFQTWSEACRFVDAWYAVWYAGEAMTYTAA